MTDTQKSNLFTGQYIAGRWRAGKAGKTLADTNPYNGQLLTEIACASRDDLDDAYRAAANDHFVDAFVERAHNLKVGDPNAPDTVIGPLINEKQFKAALSHVEKARTAGIRQVLGEEPSGQVLPPQIFVDVANDSVLAQTELFSPIAPLIRAADEAEALRMANAVEFGLSSAVFTGNVARGLRFAKGIEAGMTHINDITPNDDPNTMFGGEKSSGLGRFNSDWIIAELTTDHWISVQEESRAYPF
ncbi:MAG: aldehyde dehydrogenase family protein [Azospirillaceae bacterium]|nr:aldehyde dehydrogenase family protein [Azospirillaceae bacterium]